MTSKFAVVPLLVWGTPLAAQQAAACSGPGAAFGVTAYQCASCTIKQGSGARTQYVFQAEPIVLETLPSSMLKAGDVIEAINGEPIMTQAGADRFTYPSPGPTTITARRGNARMQLIAITSGCADKGSQPLIMVDGSVLDGISGLDAKDIETVEVLKGAAAAGAYGPGATNGVIVITTKRGAASKKGAEQATPKNEPVYVIDGVPQTNVSQQDMNFTSTGPRKFGFAVGCLPSCTRVKALDGAEYFKFDGYPPIVALTPGGPAERAGIRVGDLVSQIDGKSITGEEGALRFMHGNKSETLHVTVVRDRLPIGYVLKAR